MGSEVPSGKSIEGFECRPSRLLGRGYRFLGRLRSGGTRLWHDRTVSRESMTSNRIARDLPEGRGDRPGGLQVSSVSWISGQIERQFPLRLWPVPFPTATFFGQLLDLMRTSMAATKTRLTIIRAVVAGSGMGMNEGTAPVPGGCGNNSRPHGRGKSLMCERSPNNRTDSIY